MLTGLVLSGAYLVYSLLVSPALKPPDMRRETIPTETSVDTQRPIENVRVASTWLEGQPWASAANTHLRTDEMFIYTNEVEPRGENKQVKFSPFAAVWLSKNKQGAEQALTITAKSALLGFENAFEIDSPKPGRVTGGTIVGDVRITGPEGLEVRGDAFSFSEANQTIQSSSGREQGIQFRFGQNDGVAQSMRMKLIKGDRPVAKDRPNIVGIESVELHRIKAMNLMLRNGQEEIPVHIKCPRGRFIYQVEAHTATFLSDDAVSDKASNDVLVYRLTNAATRQSDQLRCNKLTVAFEPKETAAVASAESAEEPASHKPQPEFRRVETNLEFRALRAEGKVRIKSDKYDMTGKMTVLTYDALQRSVVLSALAPEIVSITQAASQLRCPEVELTLGLGEELKNVFCRGEGKFWNSDPESGEVVYAADWMKQLRKYSDAETGWDVVELEGEAIFRQTSQETALAGNLIRLWTTPMAAPTAGEFNLAGQTDVKPRKLLATGQVMMLHPKIETETEHLEVVFDQEDSAESPSVSGPARPSRTALVPAMFVSQPPNKNPAPAFASVPPPRNLPDDQDGSPEDRPKPAAGRAKLSADDELNSPPAASEHSGMRDDGSEQSPMFVAADSIRVRMVERPDSQEPEVANIETQGHVEVRQPSADGSGTLIVHGERLDVTQTSETDQAVNVYGEPGRPAHIRDDGRQLHLEGPTIHLRRAENRAWVEGAGLLQMPVPKSLDGKDLPTPQLLDVWWRDGMSFDGLTATFRGGVRAKLDTGVMQCQLMEVSLVERLDFSATDGSSQAQPQVKSVLCRDGVKFENKIYQEGLLMEIQQAEMFEFEFDQLRETSFAQGPGQMQMWRRGNGRRAGLATVETVQANHAERGPSTEWEYIRVDFAKRMVGQIARRSSTFHEHVQVLYGPVERPLDVLDKHNLPKFGGHMECNMLDVVQVPGKAGGKPFVQLEAAGNARLEANEFGGLSDKLSYDQSNGLYVLRSLGHRKATIWQQPTPGAPRRTTSAQRFDCIPSEGKYHFSQSIGGEGAQ
ncbi:MAG: hypothetical protein U0872_06575 [Planctomycetaceae bacterium]